MRKSKLCAFADEASPLLQVQISAMKNNGIELLEMRNVNGRNIADMTIDEVRSANMMLRDNGISIWSLGSPIGKIDITDDFDKHADKLKRLVEKAQVTDTPCIRMFSFYGVDSAVKEDLAIEYIKKMADIADGSGVLLCHENEKGIFGWNAENCKKILDAEPRLRAVFDPANFIQCGVDTVEAWSKLAPYVKYLHIKDATANGNVVCAGEGIGNLEYIMKDFSSRGGEVFSLEPHLRIFAGFESLERENATIGEEKYYPDGISALKASADAAKKFLNN